MKALLMSALSSFARREFPLIVRLYILGGMLLVQGAPVHAALAAAPTSNPGASVSASDTPDFGPNVHIFDPSMPASQIQAAVDAIYAQQVDNEMGSQRVALLFKP